MSAATESSNEDFSGVDSSDLEAFVGRTIALYHPKVGIAMSFSQEDVLIVGVAVQIEPRTRVFALDTGRLPEDTYRYADNIRDLFGLEIDWVFPDHTSVEDLLRADGPNAFRHSLEARHRCCQARKVEPVGRALAGLSAWMTGQRRGQSPTRTGLSMVEREPGRPVKLNPLAHWSFDAVEAELKRRRWPRHPLYAEGFRSIGCAPCTRAVGPGEDERAGRWWWESAEHKECGLHARPEVKGR